jgi:hypothetical protein
VQNDVQIKPKQINCLAKTFISIAQCVELIYFCSVFLASFTVNPTNIVQMFARSIHMFVTGYLNVYNQLQYAFKKLSLSFIMSNTVMHYTVVLKNTSFLQPISPIFLYNINNANS